MPPRPSDQALKRFIAELAEATDDDIEAVLAQLEPQQRSRARALLDGYQGGILAEPVSNARVEGGRQDLSPWLLERLQEKGSARSSSFRMTPAATAALRAAVADLHIASPVKTSTNAVKSGTIARFFRRARMGQFS